MTPTDPVSALLWLGLPQDSLGLSRGLSRPEMSPCWNPFQSFTQNGSAPITLSPSCLPRTGVGSKSLRAGSPALLFALNNISVIKHIDADVLFSVGVTESFYFDLNDFFNGNINTFLHVISILQP